MERRVGVVVAVAATLLAGCGGGTTAGSGTPSGSAASSSPSGSAASSPAGRSDNGVSALSADEIVGKAKAALAAAPTVHIAGTGEDVDGRIRIDMRYGSDGATGVLSIGGDTVKLTRLGDSVYLDGDRRFWTSFADDEIAGLVAGKVVKAAVDDERFRDLADLTDLKRSAYDFLDPSGAVRKGGRSTVAGVPVIEVVDEGEDGGTLSVATTGTPYPLLAESPADRLTFTEYGKAVRLPQPPAARVLDAESLPD